MQWSDPSKKIQMTKNLLPQIRSAAQHSPKFLSGDCKAAYIANSSFRMGWRNSGTRRDPTRQVRQQVNTDQYRPYDTRFPQPASFSTIYFPVIPATRHCFQTSFILSQVRWVEWCGVTSSGSFVCWAWMTLSCCSPKGVYECNKDNRLTDWSIEVLSVWTADLCERLSVSSTVTVTYWQCS
jgi:hypothetical protein